MKPHTPPPWLCNDGKHIISESGTHIATINMDGLSRDEVEANMSLLCASPELLSVLKEAMPWLEGREIEGDSGCKPLVEKVKQLLANF